MCGRLLRTGAVGIILVMTVCSAAGCFAASMDQTPQKRSKKLWALSVTALIVVNVLDVGTSVGRYEQNPALRDSQGRFNPTRGILVKSAASGSSLLLQLFLARSMPKKDIYKPAAIVNLTCAGVLGGVVLNNTRQPKAPKAPVYLSPQ